LLFIQILYLRPGLTELSIIASIIKKVTETIDNLEATARFLYTLLKQIDLKDIHVIPIFPEVTTKLKIKVDRLGKSSLRARHYQ
jgi:hypothetical protein